MFQLHDIKKIDKHNQGTTDRGKKAPYSDQRCQQDEYTKVPDLIVGYIQKLEVTVVNQ